jgi:hypothetical protein
VEFTGPGASTVHTDDDDVDWDYDDDAKALCCACGHTGTINDMNG